MCHCLVHQSIGPGGYCNLQGVWPRGKKLGYCRGSRTLLFLSLCFLVTKKWTVCSIMCSLTILVCLTQSQKQKMDPTDHGLKLLKPWVDCAGYFVTEAEIQLTLKPRSGTSSLHPARRLSPSPPVPLCLSPLLCLNMENGGSLSSYHCVQNVFKRPFLS